MQISMRPAVPDLSHRTRPNPFVSIALLLGSAPLASAQSFQQTVELAAKETAHNDSTGHSVALAGDVMAAGAPYAPMHSTSKGSGSPGTGRLVANDVGAAFVFRRTAGVWSEEQELTASDPTEGAWFGWSIAMKTDVVVVGAIRGTGKYGAPSGAAYVYRWNGASWIQEQKLLPSDSGTFTDQFGYSVAISHDVIVVGAPGVLNGSYVGEVYVYRYSSGQWLEEAKFVDTTTRGASWFGGSVSIDGDVFAVGESGGAETQVYRYSNGQWNFEQTLSDGSQGCLGNTVSVYGDAIAISDPCDHTFTGAVAIFRFNGIRWNEEQKVYPSDGKHWDLFGEGVSLGQGLLVVGSIEHSPPGEYSVGQAYVYSFNGANWSEIQKLDSNDAASGDEFGFCVALSGNDLAIGAPYDNEAQPRGGSVYMFQK